MAKDQSPSPETIRKKLKKAKKKEAELSKVSYSSLLRHYYLPYRWTISYLMFNSNLIYKYNNFQLQDGSDSEATFAKKKKKKERYYRKKDESDDPESTKVGTSCFYLLF